ncbi:MAG: hypothetical protein ACRYF2_18105 [Janthinobacterium lividum]
MPFDFSSPTPFRQTILTFGTLDMIRIHVRSLVDIALCRAVLIDSRPIRLAPNL